MSAPQGETAGREGVEPLTRMELVISYGLRIGVLVSAAIIAIGVLWMAVTRDTGYARVLPHHLSEILAFHQAAGPAFFPTSVREIVRGAAAGKPYAIVGLGLLLLIATPVVRVALSVFFFLAQRDWLYVGITLFVLGVLLVSLFSGIG
jgi:uncharacterized membrane protein